MEADFWLQKYNSIIKLFKITVCAFKIWKNENYLCLFTSIFYFWLLLPFNEPYNRQGWSFFKNDCVGVKKNIFTRETFPFKNFQNIKLHFIIWFHVANRKSVFLKSFTRSDIFPRNSLSNKDYKHDEKVETFLSLIKLSQLLTSSSYWKSFRLRKSFNHRRRRFKIQ